MKQTKPQTETSKPGLPPASGTTREVLGRLDGSAKLPTGEVLGVRLVNRRK